MANHSSEKSKVKNIVVQSDMIDLIYTIRGKRVMLDRDIASMYNTETRKIN